MTPTATFLLLLLVTTVWFLLPLIPAIRELVRPTDIAPLQVVGRDAGDVALFARGFRAYLNRQLERLATDTPEEMVGTLTDRTPFVRGRRLPDPLLAEAAGESGLDRVVVLTGPAALPGGETFVRELYATAAFAGGPRAVYRAVLGDASITLGPGSAVLRWVHARGDLLVGDGSFLSGRASSDQAIRLGGTVGFDRLAAPRIGVAGGGSLDPLPSPTPTPFAPPTDRTRAVGDHLRVEGDLSVPAGAVLTGNLVITGHFTLGPGAHLIGSVKVHRSAHLEAGAVVDGAVISRSEVAAGFRVTIGGPLVAEESVHLGPGTVVGQSHLPTSISAPRIVLEAGVQVHGLITASEGGSTAAVPQ